MSLSIQYYYYTETINIRHTSDYPLGSTAQQSFKHPKHRPNINSCRLSGIYVRKLGDTMPPRTLYGRGLLSHTHIVVMVTLFMFSLSDPIDYMKGLCFKSMVCLCLVVPLIVIVGRFMFQNLKVFLHTMHVKHDANY